MLTARPSSADSTSPSGHGRSGAPGTGAGHRWPGWLGRTDGRTLSEQDWQARHKWILLAVWLHVPALAGFALVRHDPWVSGATFPAFEPAHVVLEMLPLVAFAVLASWPAASRRVRSVSTSLALITASALLTHFSGGYIEAHFHFFVVLGVIALYHDWVPFGIAILYVAVHHGLAGTIDPRSVYNHPAAWAHPWRWAVIHAVFVLALSVVELSHWRSTQAAHDRTALVMRSAGDGIVGVDSTGTVTFANAAAAGMLGKPREDLTGRAARDVFTHGFARVIGPDGQPRQGSDGGRMEERDVAVQAHGGAVRWFDWTSDPVRDDDETKGTVVVLRDVSARRESERRTLEAQRLAKLTTWSWDPERSDPVRWADGAPAVLGVPPGDPALQHPLRLVHPEDRARVAAAMRTAAGGRPMNLTCRLLTPVGEMRSVHVQGQPNRLDMWHDDGSRLVGTVQDITERERVAQLEAEAEEQRAEVERLRRQDDFKNGIINNIAHELNTPLTPLRVQLHLLSRGADRMDDGQRRALGVIERNMQRFEKLVQDMVETARIQNDRIALRRSRHDVVALAQEAMAAFEPTAEKRDVRLTYDGPATVMAEVDPDRMLQVFYNLVSNAMKFAPQGGQVRVRGHDAEGGMVSFGVDDSGPGVPAAAVERMFQPFAAVESRDGAEVADGTGLGLFIVRGLVERHGGRVWCNAKGALGGAHFGFAVPIVATDPDGVQSGATQTASAHANDDVLSR